jgi:hypothetical protein
MPSVEIKAFFAYVFTYHWVSRSSILHFSFNAAVNDHLYRRIIISLVLLGSLDLRCPIFLRFWYVKGLSKH